MKERFTKELKDLGKKLFNKNIQGETVSEVIDNMTKKADGQVATLNESGKIPQEQLPSYVDDVIEGYLYEGAFYEDSEHTTEITGEAGKIYVDLTSGNTYRWSGTIYVAINDVDLSNYYNKDEIDEALKNVSGKSINYYSLKPTIKDFYYKAWNGLLNFDGSYVWTDGINIYYSLGANHYVLNVLTSTWEAKTWSGLTDFDGHYVWTDGTNIYYSKPTSTQHYVLNVLTSTWEAKTWNGLTSFGGSYVWTDGTNIYYSLDTNQYVLNTETSTWEAKTWNGLTSFSGSYVWTDGINIYYSLGANHYVLNVLTSTWEAKTWKGLTSFSGSYVWTDGTNIYYSLSTNQYVLNTETSTWEAKTWKGMSYNPIKNYFTGDRIWTDGTNIYFSYNQGINSAHTILVNGFSTKPTFR